MRAKQKTSPPTLARLAAGLTLEQAAKRARVTSGYLRQVERGPLVGCPCSYGLGERLAHIYQCSPIVFLQSTGHADAHKVQRK